MAAIHIDSTRPIGRIAPEIYGHFSEHLGRCIYEGIFVRPESGIPNVNGMRTDVVEALREIKIPVLRWPGGCFADEYHWQDGIGPRGQRKRMVNTHWGGVSPMAELRKENGHAEPWKVDYFGVGNENWGCSGNMTPEYYANLYGRWKALHYYARRFFAPVLISCHEEGVLSQNTNVNAELFPLKKSARLNVSNETPRDFKGQARWALRRADAGAIEEGVFDVAVPALSALWLPEQDFSGRETYDCYYSYELKDESGAAVGEGSVLFCAPKHFRFADPKLEAHIEGGEVVWPQ